jgi:hypothetical protein
MVGAFFCYSTTGSFIFVITRMAKLFKLFFIAVATLAACSVTSTPMRTTPPEGTEEVFVDPSVNLYEVTDPVNLKFAQQIGDFIVLDVSYSGGCEEHEFRLESNGAFSSTYPPEVEVTLKHNGNDDRCRGVIDKKLWFDLTPLKYDGTNRVLLVITNTETTLEYNY